MTETGLASSRRRWRWGAWHICRQRAILVFSCFVDAQIVDDDQVVRRTVTRDRFQFDRQGQFLLRIDRVVIFAQAETGAGIVRIEKDQGRRKIGVDDLANEIPGVHAVDFDARVVVKTDHGANRQHWRNFAGQQALESRMNGGMRQRICSTSAGFDKNPESVLGEDFGDVETVERAHVSGTARDLAHPRTVMPGEVAISRVLQVAQRSMRACFSWRGKAAMWMRSPPYSRRKVISAAFMASSLGFPAAISEAITSESRRIMAMISFMDPPTRPILRGAVLGWTAGRTSAGGGSSVLDGVSSRMASRSH